MRVATLAVLLLASPLASAEDAGDAQENDAGLGAIVPADAAVFVDAAMIACDGALCEARNGTTCDVSAASPGRFSPSGAGPFAILAGLALATRRARLRGTGATLASGTSRPPLDHLVG